MFRCTQHSHTVSGSFYAPSRLPDPHGCLVKTGFDFCPLVRLDHMNSSSCIFATLCLVGLITTIALIPFIINPVFALILSSNIRTLIFKFLLGGQLSYNVVLVPIAQQCESAVCILISPPSQAFVPPPHSSLQVITEHRAELRTLINLYISYSV